MKELPILFSGPMVQALLAGSKTQTRRLMKLPSGFEHADISLQRMQDGYPEGTRPVWECHGEPNAFSSRCPYGAPGDRMWVKETHYRYGKWVRSGKTKNGRQRWRFRAWGGRSVMFPQDFDGISLPKKRTELGWHKRPSIFMPRWASRLVLEVTAVRVERLQDISGRDAKAEGVDEDDFGPPPEHEGFVFDYRAGYAQLWDSLNAARGFGWKSNPWVWVVEFKRAS